MNVPTDAGGPAIPGDVYRRRKRRLEAPPGSTPGTLVSDPDAKAPILTLTAYGPNAFDERRILDPADAKAAAARFPSVWLNVDGLGDAETVRRVGEVFGLHALALEDVLTTHHRSKVEVHPECLFVVMKMCELSPASEIVTDHLGMFVGKTWVITFQEHEGDAFGPVRERLRNGHGRLRSAGVDYLAYALLDAVVDNYFPMLERFSETLETLEDEALLRPDARVVRRLHDAKRELLLLRRAVWPQREVLNALCRDETPWVAAETRLYLRDCYDHVIEVMDLVETYRELSSGLMEVYLSSVSNRMNEVMKVLTLFSTIFMPLTFIAGIYGMNFHGASPFAMPELGWYLGYPLCLAAMAMTAAGLLWYFHRRGWIGRG